MNGVFFFSFFGFGFDEKLNDYFDMSTSVSAYN